MNIAEFESQLAKIGKRLYVFSQSDATQRFAEMDHDEARYESFFGKLFRPQFCCETDSGYSFAVRDWVQTSDITFYGVEVCDSCAALTCANPKHKHEWGVTGFGHTLNDAFVDIIDSLKKLRGIDYSYLFNNERTSQMRPNNSDKILEENYIIYQQDIREDYKSTFIEMIQCLAKKDASRVFAVPPKSFKCLFVSKPNGRNFVLVAIKKTVFDKGCRIYQPGTTLPELIPYFHGLIHGYHARREACEES